MRENFRRCALRMAVAAGLAVAGATGASSTTAAADPGPPVDPAAPVPAPADPGAAPAPPNVAPPAATIGSAGSLLNAAAGGLILGQSEFPALPGTASFNPPSADILNAAQLLAPQNYRVPSPDQVSPYPLAPAGQPSPFARINQWQGMHAMLHGALGRMPADQLGQPLPGTAPPPGVNIPAGPEQFLPDPADAVTPPPPPAAPIPPPG